MIHQNGGIFSGFSLTKFHYHELVATFAKHDDFIMKHTDSMYKNEVYCKCIVYMIGLYSHRKCSTGLRQMYNT